MFYNPLNPANQQNSDPFKTMTSHNNHATFQQQHVDGTMNPFAHSHLSNPTIPNLHTHSVASHWVQPDLTNHGVVQGHMVHAHLSHNPGFGGGHQNS